MGELNYKNLSYISILFFAANFLLSLCSAVYLAGLCFGIVAVCMLLLDKFKDMIQIKIILIMLMFLPVLVAADIQGRMVSAVIAVVTLALMRKHEETPSRDRKLYFVQGLILLMFLMIFMGSMLSGKEFADKYMVPYAILYFSLLAVMTAVLSVSVVRNFLINISGKLLVFFGAGMLTLINAIFQLVYSILSKLSTSHKSEIIKLSPKISSQTAKADNVHVNMNIYYIIEITIIIVIMIIIVFSLMRLQYKKETKTANFYEKKEHVKIKQTIKHKSIVYSRFKRGGFKNKVRYYYHRFMKDYSKQGIDIMRCDTTDDINKKAVSSFKDDNLDEMRKIYLKARYTDMECTREDYEKFYMCYKQK